MEHEDSTGIDLIVGLGNPGTKYTQTRHNAGFWFVDEVARDYGATLKFDSKYDAEMGKCLIGEKTVWLMKPQTFMNLSGKSVGPFARFYKIPPERILVVHDELDFEPGIARMKKGGGAGGHNGISDIAQKTGSKDFYRLRIGIGRPDVNGKVDSWVLQRPTGADQRAIDDAIAECRRYVRDLVDGRFEEATTAIHSALKPAPKPAP